MKCPRTESSKAGHSPSIFVYLDSLSNIPRPASKNFTGRETLLKQLEDCLVPKRGAKGEVKDARRTVFVLCGLGGAGKTQVSLKFAETHKKE